MSHPTADSQAPYSPVQAAAAQGKLVLGENALSILGRSLDSPHFQAARLAASRAVQLEAGSAAQPSHCLEFTFQPHPRRLGALCQVRMRGDAAAAALAGVTAALLCLHAFCRSAGWDAALDDIRLQSGSKQGPPQILAVSGIKNSGKTTLITAVLPYLRQAGCSAAVIKHDGHSFEADPADTDTGKFMAAGAAGAAIFDAGKYKSIHLRAVDEEELIPLFPDADLILLEGFKRSAWPKLEVVRSALSSGPICKIEGLLGVVTDLPLALPVPVLPLSDPEAVAEFLLSRCAQRRMGQSSALDSGHTR